MEKQKKPKYNNEAILIHCMNRVPHSLIFDDDFKNYESKIIKELCEDLDANFDYLISIVSKSNGQEFLSKSITIANSLVWAAIFHVHNDILPEQYKEE
jgi:hypothetical protein